MSEVTRKSVEDSPSVSFAVVIKDTADAEVCRRRGARLVLLLLVIVGMACTGSDAAKLGAASPRSDQQSSTEAPLIAVGGAEDGKIHFLFPNGDQAGSIEAGDSTNAWNPRWSPDRSHLVFACRFDDGSQDVCSVARDGTGFSRLTHSRGLEILPDWSPGGDKIAFSRNERIWVMDVDGSNERKVPRARFVGGVAWLSDRRLVYAGGSPDGANLFTISMSGRHRTRLGPKGKGRESEPQVSPDGKWILFVRQAGTRFADIFRIRIDGRRERRVTKDCCSKGNPSWSPSGRRIVYFNDTYLIRARADGTDQIALPAGDGGIGVDWG